MKTYLKVCQNNRDGSEILASHVACDTRKKQNTNLYIFAVDIVECSIFFFPQKVMIYSLVSFSAML